MIKQALQKKVEELPDAPGVYYFLGSRLKARSNKLEARILYIGKATSLCDRVKSYFSRDIQGARGPLIAKMVEEIEDIRFIQTDSVLEALILEANEIKKHQPYYNSREKDDKSYNFVVVTEEEYPRILIFRGRSLFSETNKESGIMNTKIMIHNSLFEIHRIFGPFPHGSELREALKIVRKIFPYRDEKCKFIGKPCFNAQLGLCPGSCAGWISKRDYRKNIRHIITFFEGKKDKLIRDLEKEMNKLAKEQKFEEAEKVRRKIFALDHIQDVALIKSDLTKRNFDGFTLSSGPRPIKISSGRVRIEAYDIAHLGGQETVGVMAVVEDGELTKSEYRKFRIRGARRSDLRNSKRPDLSARVGIDDTKNLQEVLRRRLGHPEWRFPNLVVVDGGVAQINAARAVLREVGLEEVVDVVSVVKDERHKAREILGLKGLTLNTDSQGQTLEKAILLANPEAHRFAISYHRKLRSKGFRI